MGRTRYDLSLSALRTPSHEERFTATLARRRGTEAGRSVRWNHPTPAYEEARLAAHFGSVSLDLKAMRLRLYREAEQRLRPHGGFYVYQGRGKRPY